MSDFPDFKSRRYQPDPAQCCERCVFGRGEHAEWCKELEKQLREAFGVLKVKRRKMRTVIMFNPDGYIRAL